MKATVIGAGYVGLVTGACLAELGHEVICVETDKRKIRSINESKTPFYEEGLEAILKKVRSRLKATPDLAKAIRESELSFICVGTPSRQNGSIELKQVKAVAKAIGLALRQRPGYHLVVVKSTVVPGATETTILPLLAKNSGKKAGKDFGVAMNPEFLRKGRAVYDFYHSDRIVIGGIDQRSVEELKKLYRSLKSPVVQTDLTTAEMIKYASNAFLAIKVSFINEIGNLCKALGIDVYNVARGMGYDVRIAPDFLKAGPGFGGSCFPKDIRALIVEARRLGVQPFMLEAVLKVNREQPLKLVKLARDKLGTLTRKKIGVLGLAFKENTDDLRESPAIPLIKALLKERANVYTYDPMALESAREVFGSTVYYESSAKNLAAKVEAVIVVTPWEEFADPSLYRGKMLIDSRYIFGQKIPTVLITKGSGGDEMKAVIPAAGLGTRFLPATKAQPKEMLPVVDKPTIQYVVEEAVASGIDDVLIVTGRGKRAIEDHFDKSVELENFLEAKKDQEYLNEIKKLNDLADIHYIRQGESKGLGDAIFAARKYVGDEPFAVLLGDTITLTDIPCTKRLRQIFDDYQATVIAVEEASLEKVSSTV